MTRVAFFNRIEAISQYLHARHVPPHLNEQVRNYKDEYPEFREVLKKVSSEKTEKGVNLLLKGVTL